MKKWTGAVVAVLLIIGACGKEEGTELTDEQRQEIAQEKIRYSLDGVGGMVDMASGAIEMISMMGGLIGGSSPLKAQQYSQCPVFDLKLTGDCQSEAGCDVNLKLDWGDGCVGDDGVFRKGKITLSGKITSTSVDATAEFDNFEEEGNKITSGTLSVSLKKTEVGYYDVTVKADNIKGENQDGSYSADFEISLSDDIRGTEGDDSDDLMIINGNGTLSSDKGSINITVTDVKVDNKECDKNPISGSVDIKIDSDEAYGTIKFTFHEECDGKVDVQADLTIGESSIKVNTSVPLEEE